ncbi:MAG: hypothetical protein AAFP19_15695 [Bacteroidota bacterium]
MNKEFDRFIQDHSADFDQVEQPDAEAFWEDFESKHLHRSKGQWIQPVLAIAASMAIALSAYFLHHQPVAENDPMAIENLYEIDPQLAEYQTLLTTMLAIQDSTIKSLNIDLKDYPDIQKQLKELDELTQKYREDLHQYGPDRKIIKALLQCAKQRVRIYELLLFEIELNNYQDELEYQT